MWYLAMLGLREKSGSYRIRSRESRRKAFQTRKRERPGGAGNWPVILHTIKKNESRIKWIKTEMK